MFELYTLSGVFEHGAYDALLVDKTDFVFEFELKL